MWRVLIAALLVGCGDSSATHDAAVDSAVDGFVAHRTAPFTLLLCSSGNPGDATCPFNVRALVGVGLRRGRAAEIADARLPRAADLAEARVVRGAADFDLPPLLLGRMREADAVRALRSGGLCSGSWLRGNGRGGGSRLRSG